MNRVPLILASVAVLVLSGCSVTVAGPTSEPPAPPSTSAAPVASGTPGPSVTASVTPGQVLPGYAPGQFPAIPLFSLPDTSVLSKGGKKLREKLELTLPDLPGVKVKAVQCGKDGTYINEDSSLVLYGDGSGSYVGPDGSYTRGRDGSETSVSGKESITRNGKGGGTYVSGDLSISNDGTGSGTYVSAEVSITLDGKGGGSYVGPLGSITNDGNGSGTYVDGAVAITNDGNGSGTYVDDTFSISNDGRGTASVVSPDFSGEVPADPLPPVPPLGKFPPVVQVLPRTDICGFVITLADGVLFDFDKYDIRADASGVLDDLAAAMTSIDARNAEVSGHTDAIGTDAYNQTLSEHRARSVVDALVKRGVATSMTAKGYGESRPVAPNELNGKDNPAGRQLNRRVEIFVRS
ncbi:OmpA family protein [Propioniciclava sp.]|uniref:OmpA family protein n=1 Tax=Propioniciclava sp. TaxID=2038686 RepID=UPI00261C8401|nr:OmpA family protein [Propioniciclava sp.]